MIRTRLASASALLAVVLASSITPASAASGTTRWVDDDGHAGPAGCAGSASAAKHIQDAVDASHAGDTVTVCPGTYQEQVTIQGNRDGLTLQSSTPFGAVIKAPSSLDGFGALVVVYKVDGVTVRGFRIIARTQAPCDNLEVAVAGIGVRDVAFRGNRVLAPGSGSGADCNLGVGIGITDTVDEGNSSRASNGTIAYNEVRDAAFLSIVAIGQKKTVNVSAIHNSVRSYFGETPADPSSIAAIVGAEFGIGYLGKTRGVIRNNVIQGSTNAPKDGATFYAGIGIGSDFDSNNVDYANGPIEVRGNTIRRVIYGLYLSGVDQVTFQHNQISNSYAGIWAQAAKGNTISGNGIGAKEIGLILDSASEQNVLRNNDVTGAGGFCVDQSSGGGTAGTANTWTGNTSAFGSDPIGICSSPKN